MTSAKPKRKIADRSRFENKCHECDKNFIKPSQLKRHMMIHTGERPFKVGMFVFVDLFMPTRSSSFVVKEQGQWFPNFLM